MHIHIKKHIVICCFESVGLYEDEDDDNDYMKSEPAWGGYVQEIEMTIGMCKMKINVVRMLLPSR